MNRKLSLLIGFGVLLVGAVLFFKAGNIGTTALWSWAEEGKWLLPLVVVAALIDSINPCAFSILILTIAFLFSIGKLRSGVLEIGSSYILAIFLVYMLIGLGVMRVPLYRRTVSHGAGAASRSNHAHGRPRLSHAL